MFLDGLRKATVTPEELIFGRLRWFFFFFSVFRMVAGFL